MVKFLLGGIGNDGETYLAAVDELGTIFDNLPYYVEGYAGYYNYSVLDSAHTEGATALIYRRVTHNTYIQNIYLV